MPADLGKLLILAGLALAALGVGVRLVARTGFRGLPGDVAYRGEHVRVYVPVVSCVVLSVIGTGVLWLWRWWAGR